MINKKAIRRLCKEHGKGISQKCLIVLEQAVEDKVLQMCRVHNAGRKVIGVDVAIYCGIHKLTNKKEIK